MWRRVLLIAGSFVALSLSFGCGLMAGLMGGTSQVYHMRYLEEREAVAPLLAADPAFAGVEIHERSSGGLYLIGVVPAQVDLDRLRDQVSRAIGDLRCREAMIAVSVKR